MVLRFKWSKGTLGVKRSKGSKGLKGEGIKRCLKC